MPGGSDSLKALGIVREALENGTCWVELPNGHLLLGHLSKTMRMNSTRILSGDKVLVELSPFDLSRGRIAERH
jgi:translation initiation factor IF-1